MSRRGRPTSASSVNTDATSAGTVTAEQITQILLSLTQTIKENGNSVAVTDAGLQSVPIFDPARENLTVGAWINKIEQLAAMYNWTEATVIQAATTRLAGYAQVWFNSLIDVNNSWIEWKRLLTRAFPEETDYANSLRKMLARRKEPNEDLLKYYYEKLALITATGTNGARAVNLLLDGISDATIQHAAKVAKFQEPEDLLVYFKTVKTSVGTVDQRKDKLYKKEPRKPVQTANYKDFTPRCYRCNQRGHIRTNCPMKGNRNTETVKALTTNGKKVNGNSKYFVMVKLNGHDVHAFIDFGATVMTINKSTVLRMKLNILLSRIKIKGFGGGIVETIGKTEDLLLEISGIALKLSFCVVEDVYQTIPLIIGHPFTENPNVMVIKDSETLQFVKNPDIKSKFALYAKANVVIPSNYVGFVECVSKDCLPGDYYIDGSVRLKEGKESAVPNGVYYINENSTLKLPVANLSSSDIILREGKILARAQPCTPREENTLARSADSSEQLTMNDFNLNINSELDANEKNRLLKLVNKYRHCFAVELKEIGCTKKIKMPIKLIKDEIVHYRPYRMALAEREQLKHIIKDLLDADIIQESDSSYSSPVLLVSKPNGDKRLCIDFRKLNAITQKDRHPLPHIDDQIDRLRDYKYFTVLDLFSGYYQIPMEEEAKPKTAFSTNEGHYEFNRMPFGLANAPSIFQRLMNKILNPLGSNVATAYLDDILSPSKSVEDGLQKLECIFETLSNNGLTLNPTKCYFFQTSITYLGFEINKEGVRPGNKKIAAVTAFPQPQSVHNIRQFLGLTGFFRRFIENYALITKPLCSLLKNGAKFEWSTEQQVAFQTLKDRLSTRPILAIYDPDYHTEVHTDACKSGLAGIILQKDRNNLLRPVSFYSRQTNVNEEKYHSYELEVLAVVETLKRYRVYLLGRQFTVVTDCSAIKSCENKKELIPRIARWWLQLQEFSFNVVHKPGTKMAHVDALSRNAIRDDPPNIEGNDFVFRIEVDDWLLAGQLYDTKLASVHQVLEKNPTDEYERKIHENYKLSDNKVYRKVKDKYKWVVPRQMRRDIVRMCHDEMGHFSLEKTMDKVQESYWFPNMAPYIAKYIQNCIPCMFNKRKKGKKEGYLHPIDKVPVPFHTLHLDHLGPLPNSSGRKFVLAVIDAYTKFLLLCATKNTSVGPVNAFLKTIFSTYGVPTRVVSDKGSAFTSKAFAKFCEDYNIKHVQNAVATPRANGQIERYNATILDSLRTSIKNDTQWVKNLTKIQFSINNTINATTEKTASEMLMGYRPRSDAEAVLNNAVLPNRPVVNKLEEMRQEVANLVKRKQLKQKMHFDKKRKKCDTYELNDIVLVDKPSHGEGSKKLAPLYKGPFQITKILPNDRYVVKEIVGSKRSRRPLTSVEAADKLRRWQPNDDSSSDCDF